MTPSTLIVPFDLMSSPLCNCILLVCWRGKGEVEFVVVLYFGWLYKDGGVVSVLKGITAILPPTSPKY